MKFKKLFAYILTLSLILSLAGCGSKTETSESISTEPVETEQITPPTLEEITSEVLQYAKDNEMEENGNVSEAINEEYNAGNYDSYNIYVTLKNNGLFKKGLPKGILIASYTKGGSYSYTETNSHKCDTFTLKLDTIDPETGNVKHYKTFSSEETHSCSSAIQGIGNNTTQARRNFSEDFTKMAAYLTTKNGDSHIGWIDENGKFTDVSEKVSVKNDFSGLTKHSNPCFFENYLYFCDGTISTQTIKRVPISNLSPEAVEIMKEKQSNVYPYPLPDGSIIDDATTAIREYYDIAMKYPANTNFFNDWISDTTCVGQGDGTDSKSNNNLYIYQLGETEKNSWKWYINKTPLVPYVEGRYNWNAVVSPDNSKVAFLSRLDTGTDHTAGLYIVSLNEGEPIKLQTSFNMPSEFGYNANYSVGMIDWK